MALAAELQAEHHLPNSCPYLFLCEWCVPRFQFSTHDEPKFCLKVEQIERRITQTIRRIDNAATKKRPVRGRHTCNLSNATHLPASYTTQLLDKGVCCHSRVDCICLIYAAHWRKLFDCWNPLP